MASAFEQVAKVLADGVGGALIPMLLIADFFDGLLGGEDFDEAAVEAGRSGRCRGCGVEADRVELREHENLVDAAVDAVGKRDVDEAILAGERDGGLGAVVGERLEARAATATEDDSDDVFARGQGWFLDGEIL